MGAIMRKNDYFKDMRVHVILLIIFIFSIYYACTHARAQINEESDGKKTVIFSIAIFGIQPPTYIVIENNKAYGKLYIENKAEVDQQILLLGGYLAMKPWEPRIYWYSEPLIYSIVVDLSKQESTVIKMVLGIDKLWPPDRIQRGLIRINVYSTIDTGQGPPDGYLGKKYWYYLGYFEIEFVSIPNYYIIPRVNPRV